MNAEQTVGDVQFSRCVDCKPASCMMLNNAIQHSKKLAAFSPF